MKARAHLEGRVEGRGEILAALSEPETEKSNKLPRIVGAVVAVVVVIVILAWAFGSSKPDPAATPAATTTTTTTAKGIVIKPRK